MTLPVRNFFHTKYLRLCIKIFTLSIIIFPTVLECSAEEVDINQFIRKSDYLDVKISPDGETLAARIRDKETSYIIFLNRKNLKSIGAVKSSEGDLIYDYHWANNDRIVYRLGQKTVYLDAPSLTGKMFAINKDGSDRLQLFLGLDQRIQTVNGRLGGSKSYKKSSGTAKFLKRTDNKKKILVAYYPWQLNGKYYYDNRKLPPEIAILNIYNAKYSKVQTIKFPGANAVPDDSGRIRITSFTDQNDDNHVKFRKSEDSSWETFSPPNFRGELSLSSVSRDGEIAYLWAIPEADGADSLLALNLDDGKYSTIFENKSLDMDTWFKDPLTGRAAVGVFEGNQPSYLYTDEQLGKQHAMLTRAFKGQRVTISSHSDNGEILVVFVDSDVNPGDFYLFNTITNKAGFLFAAKSWIDPKEMKLKSPRYFTARDDQKFTGYLTKAKNQASAPLVVIPHGGPHGHREYWDFNSEAQLLSMSGYHVLQVNFRGSTGFGSQFQASGYGNWGKTMVEDVIDATEAIIREGIVSDNKTCIYGASYGAFSALAAVSMKPKLYTCAIGFAGVYDLQLLLENSQNHGNEAYYDKVLKTESPNWWHQSPTNNAERIQANILLIHGDNDTTASIKQSKNMKKALEAAGNKPKWIELDRIGHGIYDDEDRVTYYTEVLKFLQKQLH